MSTHYESLHVTEDAPDEVIRASYRALSLKHHPDKAGERPQSKWKMQRIIDAYTVLSDVRKRADYDHSLRLERNPRTSVPKASIRIQAQPTRHYLRVSPHTPPRLRGILGLLSDVRLALPVVAILWFVIYWMLVLR